MIQQEAKASDQKIHDKLKEENKKQGLKPEKIFADGNYISSESIKNYRKEGQELMGYISLGNSKRHKEFKVEKFKINFEKKESIYPNGKKSKKYSLWKNGTINIYFDKKDCLNCKDNKKCLENEKKNPRRLRLNKDFDILQERRKKQKHKNFKNDMKVRTQGKSTICELVRKHGLRKAKYKGEQGRQLQFYLCGCALNVKRIIRLINNDKKIA